MQAPSGPGLDRRSSGQRSTPNLNANISLDGFRGSRGLQRRRRGGQINFTQCLWLAAMLLCGSSLFLFTFSAARPSVKEAAGAIIPEGIKSY